MSGAGHTIYHVMQVIAHDVAVISEVKDGDANGGKTRRTKNPKIVLGGPGTFWLITGESKHQRLAVEKGDTPPLGPKHSAVSPLTIPIRASSILELPESLKQSVQAGWNDIVSFVSATKLQVAYRPRDISHKELIRRFREGRLSIPSEKEVVAIEVSKDTWLTSHFVRSSTGFYSLLAQSSMRSVAVTRLQNRPKAIELNSGLVVYVAEPKWSPSGTADFRPGEEVLEAAEHWLARTKSAIDFQSRSGARLVDLLRQHIISTVDDEEEKADLSAAIVLLSRRQSLIELIPQIMEREPTLQNRLKEFEESEKSRLGEALRAQLEAENQSEQSRLSNTRAALADVETKLALAQHREALLRSETEKHDDAIRAKITDVARGLSGEANMEGRQLRGEIDQLREIVSQLSVQSEYPGHPLAARDESHKDERSAPILFIDRESCKTVISNLSLTTGMSTADVANIILLSTECLPVLIGAKSSAAAADIAVALGGDDSAIVFCDPSRISWQDLIRDETSGLAKAVDKARAHPEMLVPVAVCGITNGPCEYWVPQVIEARRLGKVPSNLAIIASSGIDGMRVPVPASVLGYIAPVNVPASSKPSRSLFLGAWSARLEFNVEQLPDALDLLSKSDSLETDALQRAARILSRTPPGIEMSEVACALFRFHEWLSALSRDDLQHEFKTYFKNIGGEYV